MSSDRPRTVPPGGDAPRRRRGTVSRLSAGLRPSNPAETLLDGPHVRDQPRRRTDFPPWPIWTKPRPANPTITAGTTSPPYGGLVQHRPNAPPRNPTVTRGSQAFSWRHLPIVPATTSHGETDAHEAFADDEARRNGDADLLAIAPPAVDEDPHHLSDRLRQNDIERPVEPRPT